MIYIIYVQKLISNENIIENNTSFFGLRVFISLRK
jgi:hypothetical protein